MAQSLNDEWLEDMQEWAGTATLDINTYWHQYLVSVTGASPTLAIADLEMLWLTDLGYTTGSLSDRWLAYLGSLGYTGGLNDRLRLFWETGIIADSYSASTTVFDDIMDGGDASAVHTLFADAGGA